MPSSSPQGASPQRLADNSESPAFARRTRRPNRLSTTVSERLIQRIVGGDYPVGALLPAEPHLVSEFGVSRPVVREAMKFLEATGLVSIRQGEGTIVREASKWNFLEPSVLRIALLSNSGARIREDAVQLRLKLELTLLAEAAPKLTEEDFAVMETQVHIMDEETALDRLQDADLAFHQVYQSRAGNQLAESIVHLLVEEMPPPTRVITAPRDSYDYANVQHRAIYEALHEGRTDDALEMLSTHITEMWTWRADGAD